MNRSRTILETGRLSRAVKGLKLVDEVSGQIRARRVVAVVGFSGLASPRFCAC